MAQMHLPETAQCPLLVTDLTSYPTQQHCQHRTPPLATRHTTLQQLVDSGMALGYHGDSPNWETSCQDLFSVLLLTPVLQL